MTTGDNAPADPSAPSQRRALRRARFVATALLALAGLALLAARLSPEPGLWLQLLRAAAEAALVGGFADWFAVTALFRRPLGLPIPHTAIIPRNKDRIGEGLGSFVAENFLRPDLVVERLRALDPAAGLACWLIEPSNAGRASGWLVSMVPPALRSLEDRELRRFLRRALEERMAGLDLGPAAVRLLYRLVEGEPFARAFAELLAVARGHLLGAQERVYRTVAARSAWWVPRTVDRRMAEAIIRGVAELLDELAQPDNPTRRQFDAALRGLIERLGRTEEFGRMVSDLRDHLFRQDAVHDYLESVWDGLRRLLLEDLARDESGVRRTVAGALAALGAALDSDPEMRRRVNTWLEDAAVRGIGPWRTEIGLFIADVVRRWDATAAAGRIELVVGRDLQYIRINGTLVGALVGCLLFLAGWLFP